MRKYFTYGSVRGAAGNGGPYRDRLRFTSAKVSAIRLAPEVHGGACKKYCVSGL